MALTVAEIERGYTSYAQLAKAVTSFGLSVEQTDEDILLNGQVAQSATLQSAPAGLE